MYWVYRYMLGNKWIYVGKSKDQLDKRIEAHANDQRFAPYMDAKIEYISLNTASDMDATESMLIKCMRPVLNVVDMTYGDLPFVYNDSSICWSPYISKSTSLSVIEMKKKLKEQADEIETLKSEVDQLRAEVSRIKKRNSELSEANSLLVQTNGINAGTILLQTKTIQMLKNRQRKIKI